MVNRPDASVRANRVRRSPGLPGRQSPFDVSGVRLFPIRPAPNRRDGPTADCRDSRRAGKCARAVESILVSSREGPFEGPATIKLPAVPGDSLHTS